MSIFKTKAAAAMILANMLVLSACNAGTPSSSSTAPSSNPSSEAAGTSSASSSVGGDAFQSDPNLNAPGEFPIVKSPVTLKVVYSTTNDMAQNYAAQYISEKTGVNFEWLVAPSDQYKEKLNLMMASGEKMDLIVPGNNASARITKVEEFKYASQGMLKPLNDYINYSSKNVKELYDSDPAYYEAMTAPDGNIYSFQTVHTQARPGTYHGTASYKMWINKSWLDRLGLQMPTTTEEFYNVLKAFKEQDANGNGDPNDEIPLSTCTSGANVQIDGFLMNAFTYNDPNPNNTTPYFRVSDDGKIEASIMDPQYREGLKYLNRLYNEGLLYPDAFTQDRATQTALNESSDVARIGAMPAQHCGYLVASMTKSDRWMEYEACTPLIGPEGVQFTPQPHSSADVFPTGLIPSSSEHPEVAFRLIDSCYTDDLYLAINRGEKDVAWREAVSGELGLNGQPATIASLTVPESSPYFGNMNLSGFPTVSPTIMNTAQEQDPKAPNGAGHEMVLYRATEMMEPYKVPMKNVIPNFYYITEENEKISSYKATINPYIQEGIARFITGDMDLDAGWDSYINELNALGMQEYISVIQSGYDRWASTAK
jgi:putative aldouronate transport system substrate-binding protein